MGLCYCSGTTTTITIITLTKSCSFTYWLLVYRLVHLSYSIDINGDNVQDTCFPGDHWRQRHDQIKHVIGCLCIWAGVPCELEVFNIFAGLIPQECLARIDRHRQRQEMVPDMKITVTVGETSRPILHELKVISSSGSRYKPYWRKRAVDKIADDLHAEYVNKARKADQKHGGAEPGQ